MALKIKLRPHEKIIIAGVSVKNGDLSTTLLIENKVPVLREKEILRKDDASSPARRIYFIIQLMYMDQENLADHHKSYWKLIRDFTKAAPSAFAIINKISEQVLLTQYYKALKITRMLIKYEQSIMQSEKAS
jgi:flagellar protein FlbT